MKTLILFATFFSTLAVSPGAGWETVTLEGREYVTAQSIRTFYRFTTMKKTGGVLEMENSMVSMKLTMGDRVAFMNGVKFTFHSKILAHQEQYLVSRIDLMMIIDPVLRPNFIRSLKPFDTVIIDPGHGGTDPGAVNALGSEKDYTLAVARILSKALEGEGFKVVMTRDADLTLSNTERVKIANREGANAIFISIHFKSKPDGSNRGIETFTCSYAGEDVNARKPRKGMGEQSASIALAVAVHGTCTLKTGLPDGGIRRINTSVLAGIGHPAILLVGGYMSNAEDARLINRVDYQQALAQSIVFAALRYNNAIR